MPPRSSSRRGSRAPEGQPGSGDDFPWWRVIPVVLLPTSVALFQASEGEVHVVLVCVAFVLGIGIAAQVRRPLALALTSVTAGGLLMMAAVVQELHEEPHGALSDSARPRRGPLHDLQPPEAPGAAAETALYQQGAAAAALGPGAETGAAGLATNSQVQYFSEADVQEADLAPATMETFSVVLPCAYEGQYAVKTVESLRKFTRKDRLKEILVVDDGSEPPLSLDFPQTVLRGSGAPVRILRHNKTLGLIAAKKTGGDAAIGDVIVFFDCHVKPRAGWEDAFLKQMKRAGDHRTVVVPTITSLDPETWEETGGAASKACYMTWSADFTWLTSPGRDVPLMSGGLLALSRRWWQETEGYDTHMVAWGGENIDQSLRTWLCGGRIEVAEGAFVAHMWRDATNPKTRLKYPMKTEDVMRNKARAVLAWLDEFKEKTMTFPEYENFVSGKQSIGDMSNFDHVRRKLKCAPFSDYIHRFSYVYVDSGLIPQEVFQLREESSGRCLERSPKENPPDGVILAPCADEGVAGGGVPELQLWHGANRDRKRSNQPCCSGFMNWNFLKCLQGHGAGHRLQTFECEITGLSDSQHFTLEDSRHPNQLSWHNGQACAAPEKSSAKSLAEEAEAALRGCSLQVVPTTDDPRRFRLKHHDGSRCLAVVKASGEAVDAGWQMQLAVCTEGEEQVFISKPMLGGLEIQAGASTYCLDFASGSHPLIYPCYAESASNANQVWHLHNDVLVWEGQVGASFKNFCLHADTGGVGFREIPSATRLNLRSCTSKLGQRFRRHMEEKDGTFVLRDEDTGKCLGALVSGGMEQPLMLGECQGHRWRELQDQGQVQHVGSKLCVDAGDEVTPIVYPCHAEAGRKQKFRVVAAGLQLQSGWEDNGRKRYFEKCLDHTPEPPIEVNMANCDSATRQGVRWTKINPHVPIERRLWDKASTKPHRSVPLGGSAEPP